MWRGHEEALTRYGLEICRAWTDAGRRDTCAASLRAEFTAVTGRGTPRTQAELAGADALPPWLGDPEFHRSHRSALVRKDPGFYRPVFGEVPDDLPYHWPESDGLPTPETEDGPALWVIRAPDADGAQDFLDGGWIGLPEPRARAAKLRRQVETFIQEVAPADLVALPLDGGAFLAVGEVTGPHREQAGPLPHRREVRWFAELPRSAVRTPAQLQDPRSLFRVSLAAGLPDGTAGARDRRAG
jgi:hypothetical protein